MAAIGGVLGIVSTVMGAQGSAQNAEFLQTQGEYNAKIDTNEAAYQKDLAAYDEKQFRKKASQMLGTNQATAATSGVDLSSQSAIDANLQNIRETELDALIIRHGGEVRSSRLLQQAALDRYAAEKGVQAERLSGAASAVSGVGNAAASFDWNSTSGKGQRTLPSSSSSSLPAGSQTSYSDYDTMGQ